MNNLISMLWINKNLRNNWGGWLKFKIRAECQLCGNNVYHEVELDGDALSWFKEQLEATGVAPISVDHGDHVLVVYLDGRGYARSSYTYPIVKKKIVAEQWMELQGTRVPSAVDVIFANWKKKMYCVPRWSVDTIPENVLAHAEVARIVSFEGHEFWVLASGDNRMIIVKAIGWHRGFFQLLQEILAQATLAEPNIVGSPEAQTVLAAIASDPFMHTLNSASIFSDLKRKARATRALRLLNGKLEPDLYYLLENLENYDTLGECILSASSRQVAFLAKNYRSLRNTGVIILG